MRKTLFIIGCIIGTSVLLYFFATVDNSYVVTPEVSGLEGADLVVPEAEQIAQTVPDIDPEGAVVTQDPLRDPPVEINAIYATAWTAGSPARRAELISLAERTAVNAVVIDIKDYSGHVLYDTEVRDVYTYDAREPRIRDINSVIKQFHDAGIYVIGRLTVFQDPVLAEAKPEWAVQDKRTNSSWKDNKGLSWIDPANRDAWDYNIAIAKEAATRGIDEINFDYIRFPSDGVLSAMEFPFYDASIEGKSDVIARFFAYVNKEMGDVRISADLFGLATLNQGDLGIGQVIEDAYRNFDYVAPMVYPSHYADGFLGYANPADHPYEIVEDSMRVAFERLFTIRDTGRYNRLGKLRPWLQDFDLGADYDAQKVADQIRATEDAFCNAYYNVYMKDAESTTTSSSQAVCDTFFASEYHTYANGWMMWSPSNVYTEEGLR